MSTITIIFFITVFVLITIFSIIAGRNIFRKNYQRSGKLNSRPFLILITLGFIQIGMAIFAFIFQLISQVLYAFIQILVAVTVVEIIFTIIFILVTYKSLSKQLIENGFTRPNEKLSSTSFIQKIIIFLSIGLILSLFFIFGGNRMFFGAVSQLAIITGNETILEFIPHRFEWQKHDAYTDMAEKYADISICNHIDDSRANEKCKWSANESMLEKIYKEKISSTKEEDVINCDKIRTELSENFFDTNIFDEATCKQIALIQEAVTKSDPLICNQIMQTIPADAKNYPYERAVEKHASCTVHFFGSKVWEDGCNKFDENLNYKFLASCSSTKVIIPYDNNPPYYWFK